LGNTIILKALVYYALFSLLGRLTYFAAMISGCRIFLDLLLRKITINNYDHIIKTVYTFLILLVSLVLISNLYNNESLILGVYEIRYYLIMVILCSGIYYYNLIDLTGEKFIKIVVIIGLLQIPFSVLQFALAGGGSLRSLDSVTGTFSVYGSLVANQLLVIGLVLSYKLKYKKDFINLNSYILILLLIVPLILSKSKSASGFVILMISFVYLKDAAYKQDINTLIKKIIVGSIVLSVAAIMFYTVFWKNYDIKQQLNLNYIVSYFTKEPETSKQIYLKGIDTRMGRIRSVTEAIKLISKKKLTFIIGCGSGSVSEASLLKMEGHYFQWYGPLAGLWRTQYSKIIAEFGTLGSLLFLFLFYKTHSTLNHHSFKNSILKDNYEIFIALLLMLSIYLRVIESHYFAFLIALFFCSIQAKITAIFNKKTSRNETT